MAATGRGTTFHRPIAETGELSSALRVLLAVLLLAAPARVIAQSAESAATAPAEDDRAQRLARFKQFITNTEDSESTRIAQAEELLSTGWPEATDLAISLLGTGDDPSTRVVVCRAVASIGERDPKLLDYKLVDPLLSQMVFPSDEVAQAAGAALATFPNGHVAESLSDIAGNAEAPLSQRLAALSALTPNTHRREVVGRLVELLDTPQKEVTDQVVAALRRVSARDYGSDVEAWRAWWKEQSALDECEWMRRQVALKEIRLRRAEQSLAELTAQSKRRYEHLAGRLTQELGTLYRKVPDANKDALLEGWLSDPDTEYRLAAAGLVAEQISEGNLPSETLKAALRKRYHDESAAVRQQAVEIIGALNDPTEAQHLLARLPLEADPRVREAILRALGKLRNVDAIEPLLAELMRADAPPGCVAAAAESLGALASRGGVDAARLDTIIGPLKARFAQAASEPREIQIAILGAMAAIGSPAFTSEFEANLSSEDPEMLLRAIQGVAIVGNGAQLDRLSNLTAHPDARVRHRALAALGELGTADQLSTVIARLSPSVETVEGPRTAAWDALQRIGSRLPIAEQIAIADRLADQPALAARHLKALYDRMIETNQPAQELNVVREKLAGQYMALDRNVEALPYLRQLFADVGDSDPGRRERIALSLLNCSLACGNTDQADAALRALTAADAPMRRTATTMITTYLDRMLSEDREPDARELAARLASVSADAFPELKSYINLNFPISDAGTGAVEGNGS